MIGFATMTLSTSSVRAEETTAQSSYPLKSENAIPPGDFNEYLSCAYTAVPHKNANSVVATTIVSLLLRFMVDPLLTVVMWTVAIVVWAAALPAVGPSALLPQRTRWPGRRT